MNSELILTIPKKHFATLRDTPAWAVGGPGAGSFIKVPFKTLENRHLFNASRYLFDSVACFYGMKESNILAKSVVLDLNDKNKIRHYTRLFGLAWTELHERKVFLSKLSLLDSQSFQVYNTILKQLDGSTTFMKNAFFWEGGTKSW